ncbi:MAG: hypothetical protein JRH20_28445 [Deltaproteobacteria bacterium]|nr:hypothetical protein [Deltaproteobacteria bacterium]
MANPYAPPESGDAAHAEPIMGMVEPVPGPPTSVPKVFGILSIIFASLLLIFGLLSGCVGMAFDSITNLGSNLPQGGQGAANAKLMMKHLGQIYFYMGIQGFAFAAMSAVLLAIGIGQLRYRRWARPWTVNWSIAAIVMLLAMVVFSFAVIGPAYQTMFESIANAGPSGAMPSAMMGSKVSNMVGGTSGVMMLVLYVPYPILQLIYFTRPRVAAVMNT